MDYLDINVLHTKHCPKKVLGNFWRSDGYKAAAHVLEKRELSPRYAAETPATGRKASTMIHPLVALEFLRWTDPEIGQERLLRMIDALNNEPNVPVAAPTPAAVPQP